MGWGRQEQQEKAVHDAAIQHDVALEKVGAALKHLRAATADLEEIRRLDRLARRKPK